MPRKNTRRSRRSTRRSRKSDTGAQVVRRSSLGRNSPKRAKSDMTMLDLQRLARSRGIPFGGLRKTQLIRKINSY